MPNLLTQEQIIAALAELPGWAMEGNAIFREFRFKDFAAALAFVNAVGAKAETFDHHPDILLHGWNKVKITFSTHSAGGVTENDIKMAHEVNLL